MKKVMIMDKSDVFKSNDFIDIIKSCDLALFFANLDDDELDSKNTKTT